MREAVKLDALGRRRYAREKPGAALLLASEKTARVIDLATADPDSSNARCSIAVDRAGVALREPRPF